MSERPRRSSESSLGSIFFSQVNMASLVRQMVFRHGAARVRTAPAIVTRYDRAVCTDGPEQHKDSSACQILPVVGGNILCCRGDTLEILQVLTEVWPFVRNTHTLYSHSSTRSTSLDYVHEYGNTPNTPKYPVLGV